jgi:hypothetical protein
VSNAFDAAKDIVVAALGSVGTNFLYLDSESGKAVAEFFEAVYVKLKEIEDQEH